MTVQTISPATQLAQHDPTGVLTPSEEVTKAIHAWVAGLDVAVQGAYFIVDTPACPDSFWPLPPDKKVHQIPGRNPKLRLPDESEESFQARRTIAAQTVGYVARYGLGLGLAPEVALNGIFVIGGRPSMYAEQMVALVKSHGHGHRVVERTAERCVVEVRHRDESEWERFEFTMEQAIIAGYVKGKGPNAGKNEYGKDKTGGNDKYNTDAPGMLYARASSIACKTKFPDVLRGMVTREELQDERAQDDPEVRVITRVTASDIQERTAAALRQVPQPVTQNEASTGATIQQEVPPAGSPAAGPAEPEAETGEAITVVQRRKIGTLLRKVDLGSADDAQVALQVISWIVDQPVDSTAHLTVGQAGEVIRYLESLAAKDEPDWREQLRTIVAGEAERPEAIASSEGADRG